MAAEQATRSHYDALVHATPLGMHPHVNECFFNGDIPAEVVFDMVYNPMETLLIRRAKDGGKEVVSGYRHVHRTSSSAVRDMDE